MSTFEDNRGIARTYFPSFINRGFTANKALSLLKECDMGYRRTTFLADWREFSGLKAKEDTFKYIRHDLKPTANTLTQTSENLSKEYSYIFSVKGKDSLTGEIKEIGWRLATDTLISLDEAVEWAEDNILEDEYGQNISDYKINIIGVKRALHL